MNLEPKQLAAIGEYLLEEAVLSVIGEANRQNELIGPAEIGRRAGIFRDRGKGDTMNDAIVWGILIKLQEDNLIERVEGASDQKGWQVIRLNYRYRQSPLPVFQATADL